MRDSLLFVSAELNDAMFGRPQVITEPANLRRTIYSFVERQNIPAMVQTFDFANADTSTPRRRKISRSLSKARLTRFWMAASLVPMRAPISR